MASTSDPPAAGPPDEAPVSSAAAPAPPPSDPPPPPPSSSSSSSKRRWSPCTWRYAIEEVQPELGSRPRSTTATPPASSLRTSLPSDHPAPLPAPSSKPRPSHGQDHALYADEPAARRSVYGQRAWPASELSDLRPRLAPSRTHDMLTKKKRPPHPPQPHQQHQQKEAAKRPKEEEEDDNEDGWDDEDGRDDFELGHHLEDGKKRKRREMSPSELYFCNVCRGNAVEAAKQSSSPDSPLPLQNS